MRRGHWIEIARHWNDTNVINCDVCGRLIPRRAWTFEGGDGSILSCSSDCEDLYESYVKPTYGVLRKKASSSA
jgi:hypothetical protein